MYRTRVFFFCAHQALTAHESRDTAAAVRMCRFPAPRALHTKNQNTRPTDRPTDSKRKEPTDNPLASRQAERRQPGADQEKEQSSPARKRERRQGTTCGRGLNTEESQGQKDTLLLRRCPCPPHKSRSIHLPACTTGIRLQKLAFCKLLLRQPIPRKAGWCLNSLGTTTQKIQDAPSNCKFPTLSNHDTRMSERP